MAKVSFFTVGCKLNQYETELIARRLKQCGFERVDWAEDADLYIVNSCNVTHKAAADSRRKLFGVKKKHPRSKAVAIGCYAQLKKEDLSGLEEIDLVLGNDEKDQVLARLNHLFPEISADMPSLEDSVLDGMSNRSRALVKVQDGCNQNCSYCIIPKARGHEISRPIEKILEEVRALKNNGYREVILTGVHVGRYRENGTALGGLVRRIITDTEIDRIRLSSLEVNEIESDLIQTVEQSGRVCRHFHIPLQSGSDRILRSMNRPYSTKKYRDIIDQIKSRIPGVMIGADLIVGFPGEGDREFAESLEFVENSPIDYLHVFSYSDHPEARSFSFDGKLDPPEIKTRNRIVTDLGDLKWKSFIHSQLDSELEVLFEKRYFHKNGAVSGLSDNYIRIESTAGPEFCNQICRVRPEAVCGRKLIGKIIS